MFKVLIADRFAVSALERLRVHNKLEVAQVNLREVHDFNVAPYDIIIIRSGIQVDEKFLQRAQNLKVIITTTSGYDHIDLPKCEARHVRVYYTPEANAQSTAELTWALILACTRKLNLAQETVRSGNWNKSAVVGQELYKKTLGIIGLGRVGSRVAKIARAFEMSVVACDPYIGDSIFSDAGVHRASWDEVLKTCDILTLHIPLTDETRGFINLATLENVSHGLILINTSRGSVINEPAVIEYLRKGRIAAMGLDVFEKEPLPKTSALLELSNVVLSPHIGANTSEAFERGSNAAVDKVFAFIEGGKVCDLLTKE